MNKKTNTIWIEKYRPDTLDNYIGNDVLKSKIERMILANDIPHLLFSGPAGTGKTTLAKIIAHNIECDYLYINASDENNVDTIRNKVKSFGSSVGFKPLKIVVLDEADYITVNGQAALRNLMEMFSHQTRFILTCNFTERIIDPIISRTQQFHIVPPSKVDVAKHLAGILQKENITFKLEDVKLLIDAHYPDIRKVIGECSSNCSSGTLTIDVESIISNDIKLRILEILNSVSQSKIKFQELRQIIADGDIRDFAPIYDLLFTHVDSYAKGQI